MSKQKGNAGVDVIYRGVGSGSVASRLLANGLNVNALRTNDVLLYDEWKEIDKAVIKAYQQRLVGVADLEARGLTYDIPNGLGKTVFAYQNASNIEDAELSMDGVTRGRRDRLEFDINYLPLPIVHADFSFSIREIEASRSGGMPLDTAMAEAAARRVAEKVEEILFQGAGTYTFGGGTLYGYEDFPHRNSGSLSGDWSSSAVSGEDILSDVLEMKQALISDKRYGPYALYVPTAYETALDDDFKSNSDKSTRQRIQEVSGIDTVRVADFLTSTRVALVQLTSDTVRVINGLDVVPVQWETEGGMKINFKVMAIKVPQLQADHDNNCGIAVFSE